MQMDLIDYLKIYKARTIIPEQPCYHFAPSTKAREELHRWPREWPAPQGPERQLEPFFPDSEISV
jgi:hypothetical protein